MGIGGALMQNPRFREQMKRANGGQDLDDTAKKQQQETAARVQNFGLMGLYAGGPARRQMNEALRVRRSEMSPSTARQMNRKGG
jgi:hypothetical protein